jgi:hypothetical protein
MTILSEDKFTKEFADVPEGWGCMAEANNMGDTKIMWDPNDPASVAVAEAAFNEAIKKKKMVAYDVDETGQKTGGIIRTFDKALARLILMPQVVAG